MLKKILCIIISLVLIFTGCSKNSFNNTNNNNCIIDANNNTVYIRENNKELTIASVYAVAVPFLSALKLTDRVKAINVKSNFWKDVDPNYDNADSIGRGTIDFEKLAKVHPDCVIHRSNDKQVKDKIDKLGIDLISIKVENIDDILYTIEILSKYFGVEDRAELIRNYINNKFSYIDSIVDGIKDDEKKTAILMGGNLGRVAGSDMLQSFMINKAGGKCVVLESKDNNWIDIGVEKIFKYNPDFIFLTSSTPLNYDADEIYNDNTWSDLNAVKNKNIYQIPTSYDSWDLPGISTVLGTFYMLYKMYPNHFDLNQLRNEINEYYYMMFNQTFDDDFLKLNLE